MVHVRCEPVVYFFVVCDIRSQNKNWFTCCRGRKILRGENDVGTDQTLGTQGGGVARVKQTRDVTFENLLVSDGFALRVKIMLFGYSAKECIIKVFDTGERHQIYLSY